MVLMLLPEVPTMAPKLLVFVEGRYYLNYGGTTYELESETRKDAEIESLSLIKRIENPNTDWEFAF